MRPIDADALKRKAQRVATEAWKMKITAKVETVWNQFIDYIDSAPTVEAPKWIPCSEWLPKEKGEYLVTYHPCYHDIVEPEVKVGIDTFRGKTSWAKNKYQKVIAWKPKPLPWEGADDEDV